MDVIEAVKVAQAYVASFPDLFPAYNLRLEETQVGDAGHWLVTLSYEDGDVPAGFPRRYKTFEIDPQKKKVLAMRMRNPLAAA